MKDDDKKRAMTQGAHLSESLTEEARSDVLHVRPGPLVKNSSNVLCFPRYKDA
jgi:hypothetical protein